MVFVCHPEDGGSGPVRDLLATLGAARARGIDVRVVLDLGREWDTGAISDKHREAQAILAAHGVPVVLDEIERTTHPKVVLVDAEHAVIGSHNWTRSAFVRNREVSTWHRDPDLVARLEPLFLAVPGFEPLDPPPDPLDAAETTPVDPVVEAPEPPPDPEPPPESETSGPEPVHLPFPTAP